MFNDWLLERLKENGWSQADLARRSGLTRGAISNYVNGRVPDEISLRKIAKAFNMPPENVFRIAGVLPQSVDDPWVNEIAYKLKLLDESRRNLVDKFIKMLLDDSPEESGVSNDKKTNR